MAWFRRIDRIGEAWTSTTLLSREDGAFVAAVEQPASGWTAFFVELTYPSGGPAPFKLTTDVRVLPDTLPYRLGEP